MNNRSRGFLLVLAGLILLTQTAVAKTFVKEACSDNEDWTLDERLPKAWMERFRKSIMPPGRKGAKPEQIFDSIHVAHRLKSGTNGPELRAIADYWVARALYQSGFIHLANEDFGAMVENLPAGLAGIQIGAVECLNRMHDKYPSLRYPPTIIQKLALIQKRKLSVRQRRIVWNASLAVLLANLNNGSVNPAAAQAGMPVAGDKLAPILELLKGAGAYESLARAWIAIKAEDDEGALGHFEAFVKSERIPPSLIRYRDLAYLSLARLYSQEKKFEESVHNFQLVSKSSNYFSQAIADLAWTHLIHSNLGGAVGAATDIHRSGLKRSFSPHADMAFAVALFELCRYPESLKAHSDFKRRYQKSFEWLDQWSRTNSSSDAAQNYRLVIGFLKGGSPVPEAVGTEWVRSPIFQSLQDEINLLLDERKAADYFYKRSTKIKVARNQRNLQQVLNAWRQQLQGFMEESNKIELELVSKIGQDLAVTNRSLLTRLQDVDDEMEFLKTEIYDAAGEDIVWQNVNKGFDKFAKAEGVTSKRKEDGAPDKLRWEVRRNPSGDSTEEIWDDELGALETEQLDLCKTKKKFIRKRNSLVKEPKVSDQPPQ